MEAADWTRAMPARFWRLLPFHLDPEQQQHAQVRLRAVCLLHRGCAKQTHLLAVKNRNQASDIWNGRAALPIKAIPFAARELHCTPEWLAGLDTIRLTTRRLPSTASQLEWEAATVPVRGDIKAIINRLAHLDVAIIQSVLDLKTFLPGTMTNAPEWLHPFLICEAVSLDQCAPRPNITWVSSLKIPHVDGSDTAQLFDDEELISPNLRKRIERWTNR